MLLHKNHQFIYDHRAALQLPDNVYLDHNPDVAPIDGIVLHSEDLRVHIQIDFLETEKSAWTYLKELNEHFEGFKVLVPVRAVSANGFIGFALSYALTKEIYEEYVFAVPGDEQTLLVILLEQNEDRLADEEVYAQLRDALLNGIKSI